MLKLDRKPGERIRINDDIIITVVGVHKGQVKFGIDAPREIVVDREEIYHKKKREARQQARLLSEHLTEQPA